MSIDSFITKAYGIAAVNGGGTQYLLRMQGLGRGPVELVPLGIGVALRIPILNGVSPDRDIGMATSFSAPAVATCNVSSVAGTVLINVFDFNGERFTDWTAIFCVMELPSENEVVQGP